MVCPGISRCQGALAKTPVARSSPSTIRACSDESVHAIDDKGQRVLDTNGTELGVSMKGDRIYWMNGESAKSVSV